ncbi:MAG: hypothetical protein AB2A00_10425 [Myxococcota bacterium]
MAETLGLILVRSGLLTREQLYEGLRAQSTQGGFLGEHLVRLKYITYDNLLQALARQFGVPAAREAEVVEARTHMANLLPAESVAALRVCPFGEDARGVNVAFYDPRALDSLPELETAARRPVLLHVSRQAAVEAAIARLYPALAKRQPAANQRQDTIREMTPPELNDELTDPMLMSPDGPTIEVSSPSLPAPALPTPAPGFGTPRSVAGARLVPDKAPRVLPPPARVSAPPSGMPTRQTTSPGIPPVTPPPTPAPVSKPPAASLVRPVAVTPVPPTSAPTPPPPVERGRVKGSPWSTGGFAETLPAMPRGSVTPAADHDTESVPPMDAPTDPPTEPMQLRDTDPNLDNLPPLDPLAGAPTVPNLDWVPGGDANNSQKLRVDRSRPPAPMSNDEISDRNFAAALGLEDEQPLLLTRKKTEPLLLTRKKTKLLSVGEAAERVFTHDTLPEIGSVAATYLRNFFPRAVVLDIRADPAVVLALQGVKSTMKTVSVSRLRGLRMLLEHGETYYGACSQDAGWQAFYTSLGGVAPAAMLVVPVKQGGVVRLMMYADSTSHEAYDDLHEVGLLAKEISTALDVKNL